MLAFTRFKLYWENSKAYCVYDILQIGPWGKLIKKARKDIEGNPFQYVLILKRNEEKFELLKKKAFDFLSNGDDKLNFNPADLMFLYYSYDYNKVIVDEAEVRSREIHALLSQYKLKLDESKHVNSIAGSIIGGALAGTTGAIIGSTIGRKNEEEYQYARQYNEKIKKEQEQALELLKKENIPTKIVKEYRIFYGIKTFMGIIPFYWDDQYERKYKNISDKEPLFSAIEKWMDAFEEFDNCDNKSKVLIALRDKVAGKFIETGEKWPEDELIWKNVKSDDEKLEDVAYRTANNLYDELGKSENQDDCSCCVKQMESLLKYIGEKYTEVNNYIKIGKNRIKDIGIYNRITVTEDEGEKKSHYESTWEDALALLKDVIKFDENSISSEDIKERVIGLKNKATELYNTIFAKKEESDNKKNEELYAQALSEFNTSDLNSLESAYEKFKSLLNYKDSKQKYAECGEKLEKIRHEIKKKFDRQEKFKRIRRIIIFAVVVITIIVIMLYPNYIKPAIEREKTYQSACRSLGTGEYDEAIKKFEELSGYRDSDEMIKESIYQKAIMEMQEGLFISAETYFSKIPSYKESDELIKESIYQRACVYIQDGNYALAEKDLLKIPSYKDSNDLCLETKYKQAEYLFNEGAYISAISYWNQIPNYLDSADCINEAKFKYVYDYYCFPNNAYKMSYDDVKTFYSELKEIDYNGLDLIDGEKFNYAYKYYVENNASLYSYSVALDCLYDLIVQGYPDVEIIYEFAKRYPDVSDWGDDLFN